MSSSRRANYNMTQFPPGSLLRAHKSIMDTLEEPDWECDITENTVDHHGASISRQIDASGLARTSFFRGESTSLRFHLHRYDEKIYRTFHEHILIDTFSFRGQSFLSVDVTSPTDIRRAIVEKILVSELELFQISKDEIHNPPKESGLTESDSAAILASGHLACPEKVTIGWMIQNIPWEGWCTIGAIVAAVFSAGVKVGSMASQTDAKAPTADFHSDTKTPHPPASAPAEPTSR